MIKYVELEDGWFGYRYITRKEFADAIDAAEDDQYELENIICSTCVERIPLDFPGFENCLAGTPAKLAELILKESGFSPGDNTLENEAIEWISSVQGRLDAMICFCFSGLSIKDLEEMSPDYYYKYAAASQLMLSAVYNVDTAALLSDNKKNPPPPPNKRKYNIQ